MTPALPRGWFWLAFGGTLALRLWLSVALPVTADEAYFVLWGRNPDLGFYDHPPMIGWMLAPLVALSNADWVARLPVTVVPALTALIARQSLMHWFDTGRETADLAGLAVLLAPLNLWGVLVTTDAPLVVFSVASIVFFARAAQRGSLAWFAISGVALGLAFLSKYFAVLLGVAYLVWAAASSGAPRRWSGPLTTIAAAVPFGLVNLWWNVDACWCNVMFNAINRHEGAGWSAVTPLLYVLAIAYLAAPLVWVMWRERARVAAAARTNHGRALVLAWLVPLAVFALLSPLRRIGLHWLLSFVPALVLTVALALDRARLGQVVRFFAWFGALHMVVLVVLAALPLETWKSASIYARLAFPGRTEELLRAVAGERSSRVLAADSYAAAAMLAYYARGHVPVFGMGTSHARHDDILTDWRDYAGKDFVILRREAAALDEYRPFFASVSVREVPLAAGKYYAVLGNGFRYEQYRASVLSGIQDRYYRIPRWLPVRHCYFFDRYFPQ